VNRWTAIATGWCGSPRGASVIPISPDDSNVKALRKSRWPVLIKCRRSTSLLSSKSEPLNLSPKPVLTCTNPVRDQAFGGTYFYLDGKRPIAVTAVAVRRTGKVWLEFSLIQDQRIEIRHKTFKSWNPKTCGRPWQELEDSKAPPATAASARLIQMRAIARTFKVNVLREEPVNTQLLSQPLIRYEDKTTGLLDSAVFPFFAFVEATDPELLLCSKLSRTMRANSAGCIPRRDARPKRRK